MPLLIKLPDISGQSKTVKYLNVLDRKKTAVQRHLRREGLGGYEPDFLATIFALSSQLKSGFTFYDVGAHIGLYSALLEKLFGATCFAFEPDPNTFREGERLKKHNNLTYTITQAAISTQAEGKIELFLSPKAETSNSLNPEFRPGGQSIFIPATSLDAYTKDGTRDPHLLKIDVETFEPEVILGGLEMLGRAKPYIACELLPKTNIARLAEALNGLESHGYRFMHILPNAPWEEHSISSVLSNLHSDERDWLFIPAELPQDFYQRRSVWLAALSHCGKATNLEIEGHAANHAVPLERPAPKKKILERISSIFQ